MTATRPGVYRSRDLVPVPLDVARASWRERSILGGSYEPPRGGWDTILREGEKEITREIHWAKPRLVLKTRGRWVTPGELEVVLDVIRGRHTTGRMRVHEKLTAAGHQTAWDIEISSERLGAWARPPWNRTGKALLKGLLTERDHRLHRMMEDAMESSWGKTGP